MCLIEQGITTWCILLQVPFFQEGGLGCASKKFGMKAGRSLSHPAWGHEVDLLQLLPFSIGYNFSRLNDQMLVQLEVTL